jgi:hypothetical protein
MCRISEYVANPDVSINAFLAGSHPVAAALVSHERDARL